VGGFQSESMSKKLPGRGQGPMYPFMTLTIELKIEPKLENRFLKLGGFETFSSEDCRDLT